MALYFGTRPLLDAEHLEPTEAEQMLANGRARTWRTDHTVSRCTELELIARLEAIVSRLSGPVDSTNARCELAAEVRLARAAAEAARLRHRELDDAAWERRAQESAERRRVLAALPERTAVSA